MLKDISSLKIQGANFSSETILPILKSSNEKYAKISILYGRNGSGKSTIAKAFRKIKGETVTTVSLADMLDTGEQSIALSETDCNNIFVFDEDFITVNPYLGTDGIKPFADVCKEEKKGMFILVKTSNPSSGEFQDRLIDGKPLYEHVAKKVVEWGADVMGDSYSYIGAVVGATYPEMGKVLRELMPKSYILVPGYGAQGGKGKDLVHFFNKDGLGAIVNSSRGIIAAYKQDKYSQFGSEAYADASRQAVLDMKEDLKQAIR